MKYCFIILLLFSKCLYAQAPLSKENNVSNKRSKNTPIYVLKYYYPEAPENILFTRAYGRIIHNNGTFCLIDYTRAEKNKPIYSSCFNKEGMPIEFGNYKEVTKIYNDSIRLNFRGKDTTVLTPKADALKDPTTLWFWKHIPKVNEKVYVSGIRKNFITNSIDLVSIAHTYLGKESIDVLGKTKTCYLVKSVPLNDSKDVYDERWYDEQGMLVKEKHAVGKDGFRIGELIEIDNK